MLSSLHHFEKLSHLIRQSMSASDMHKLVDFVAQHGNVDRVEAVGLLAEDGEIRQSALSQVWASAVWPLVDAFESMVECGELEADRGVLCCEVVIQYLRGRTAFVSEQTACAALISLVLCMPIGTEVHGQLVTAFSHWPVAFCTSQRNSVPGGLQQVMLAVHRTDRAMLDAAASDLRRFASDFEDPESLDAVIDAVLQRMDFSASSASGIG